MTITFTKKGIRAKGKDAQALFDLLCASAGLSPLERNTPASAAEPVPNRPSTLAGASGPAVAENGSKAPESKGA
jgi:hypothetical protein